MLSLAKKKIDERKDDEIAKAKAAGKTFTNADVAGVLYAEAREAGDEQLMRGLEIYAKLSFESYRLAGEDTYITKGPLARNLETMEGNPFVHAMSEEEHAQMIADLCAGVFMDKTATPEEKETAKAKNIRGLRKYYSAMSGHYEALFQKYHFDVLDASYILGHMDELSRELSNVQEDSELVDRDKTVLKDDIPADFRLRHLMLYFRNFSDMVFAIKSSFNTANPQKIEMKDVIEENMFLKMALEEMKRQKDMLTGNSGEGA